MSMSHVVAIKRSIRNERQTSSGLHCHPGIYDILYVYSGMQSFVVDDKPVVLRGGDISFVKPNIPHGAPDGASDKAVTYSLLIRKPAQNGDFLGHSREDAEELARCLDGIDSGTVHVSRQVKQFFDQTISHFHSSSSDRALVVNTMVTRFILYLARIKKKGSGQVYYPDISRCKDYAVENILEPIDIQFLADYCNLSVSRFKVKFKAEVGLPPGEFILRQKIEYSKQLLVSTNLRVIDIACELYFPSSQYFSTVFRKFAGLTPTEFRSKHANTPDF